MTRAWTRSVPRLIDSILALNIVLSDILQVNLEVQWASEQAIMAVERAGGRITTAYFDLHSVIALRDPLKFFQTGSWTMTYCSLPLPTMHFHRLLSKTRQVHQSHEDWPLHRT